jgi:hypothetical protein
MVKTNSGAVPASGATTLTSPRPNAARTRNTLGFSAIPAPTKYRKPRPRHTNTWRFPDASRKAVNVMSAVVIFTAEPNNGPAWLRPSLRMIATPPKHEAERKG